MKKTIKIFALGLLSAALMGCQNEALPVINNMVFISGADNARVGTVDMSTDGDTELQFTVRLAKAEDKDIQVSLSVDPQLLEEYNVKYQGSYKHVDKANIQMPVLATIPAGSVNSAPIPITIKSFETAGAKYAIALKVDSKDAPVAEENSKFIYYLMKPLKQQVPMWEKACAAQCIPYTDWGLELMNYTLEWWCRVVPYFTQKPFYVNNQCIFDNSSDKGTQLYIRFGDLIYGSYDFNYLQIKTMGSQFDTGNPADGKGLSPDTWYHFAITYDGNTGQSILYQDGQLVATITTAAGKPMIMDRLKICQNIYDYVEMCQVRMWKTTRTEAQINNNMRSEVEYTDPDLVLYLPMNEGPGARVLKDVANDGEGEIKHSAAFGSHPDVGTNYEAKAWTEWAF